MSLWHVVILALIQGAAELLPVSSSAHVIVAERLLGVDPASPEATFLLVMLHTGTMGAVLVYFWPRWKRLLFPPANDALAKSGGPARFVKMVVLATALTGVLGLGLKVLIEKVVLVRVLGHDRGEVEHLFRELPLIAGGLFAVGVVIIAAGLRETRPSGGLTSRSAAWVGLVQGLCLPFRGFSRSGATISTALFCGVSRPLAEDFSFALAVALTPAVIALELKRLLDARGGPVGSELVPLLLPGLLGMVFSLAAGLVALRLLSAALERGAWKFFGFYCLAASVGVLAVWKFQG